MAVLVTPTPIAAVMGTPLVVQLALDGADATAIGGHHVMWVLSDPTRGTFTPDNTIVPAPVLPGGATSVNSTFTPAAVTAGPATLDLVDTDTGTVLATVNVTVAAAPPAQPPPGPPAPPAPPAPAGPAPVAPAAPGAAPAAPAPAVAPAAGANPPAAQAPNAQVAGGMVFHAPVNGGVHIGGAPQQAGGLDWRGRLFGYALFAGIVTILLLLLLGAVWGLTSLSDDGECCTASNPTSTDRVEIPRATPVTLPDPIKVEVTIKDGDPPPSPKPQQTTKIIYCGHPPNCD